MRTEITAGQTSDYLGFDLVMADNLPEPSVLLADRGYDSDNIRKTMEVRDVVPVIPMRKTRKLRVAVDRRLYRLRNLVERCFNKLKNARRVATRLTTRPPKASWASSTSRRSAYGSAICQHDLMSIGPRPDPAHLIIRLPANMLTPIARRRGPANSSATVPDVEETDSNIRLNSPPLARMTPVRNEV